MKKTPTFSNGRFLQPFHRQNNQISQATGHQLLYE